MESDKNKKLNTVSINIKKFGKMHLQIGDSGWFGEIQHKRIVFQESGFWKIFTILNVFTF